MRLLRWATSACDGAVGSRCRAATRRHAPGEASRRSMMHPIGRGSFGRPCWSASPSLRSRDVRAPAVAVRRVGRAPHRVRPRPLRPTSTGAGRARSWAGLGDAEPETKRDRRDRRSQRRWPCGHQRADRGEGRRQKPHAAGAQWIRQRAAPPRRRRPTRASPQSISSGRGPSGGGNARSSSARSRFVSRSSIAPRFSFTCFGRPACGMAMTPSRRSTQASVT